ncbi:MAG: peptidylprolyl isomerase [Candidatus Solibacter sp.]
MKRLSTLLLTVLGVCVLTATAQTTTPPAPARKAAAAPAKSAAAPAKSAAPAKKEEPEPDRPPGLYWILNTSMGKITAQLYEKDAPGTVANFVALTRGTKAAKDKSGAMTKRPYFNGVNFHRVIAGFMIQTGDGQQGDGSGDCGFTIKDEIVPPLKFDKPGVLGLARLDRKNTGACQFFIMDDKYPSLNNEYTVFGQVVDGQDVVGKIARVPKDPSNDKPRTPVKILTATIKRYGPAPAAPAPAAPAPAAPATKSAAPAKKAAPAAPAK